MSAFPRGQSNCPKTVKIFVQLERASWKVSIRRVSAKFTGSLTRVHFDEGNREWLLEMTGSNVGLVHYSMCHCLLIGQLLNLNMVMLKF